MNYLKGFSMLEVVIASAIALVVGTFMLSILTTNTGVFYQQRSAITTGLSLNDATSRVTDVIRQASVVATGYPLISPAYITSATTLVVKLQSYDVNGPIADTYDFAVITKDSSKPQLLKLLIFVDPGSIRKSDSRILVSILDNINFKYMDLVGAEVSPVSAKQIEVTLTTASNTGTLKSKRTAVTTASLNNMQN